MGFFTGYEVKQALTGAGVRSIMDLFTMEIDLVSQLTYKVGTERERVCGSWMSPSSGNLVPSMTHCVIEKTSCALILPVEHRGLQQLAGILSQSQKFYRRLQTIEYESTYHAS